MFTINNNQIRALDEHAMRAFEQQLVAHAKTFAPRLVQTTSDEGLLLIVQNGISRAKKYGFTNQGPVRFYLELMLMFGSDFDTDPQLPWATEVLKSDTVIVNQMTRADNLHGEMLAYLDAVSGPEGAYRVAALHRLQNTRIEDIRISWADFENGITVLLKDIYPRKCAYLGAPLLSSLAANGLKLARAYSLPDESGPALMTILPFFLGHGFAADPQFPWISTILQDVVIASPDNRIDRLQAAIKNYLGE